MYAVQLKNILFLVIITFLHISLYERYSGTRHRKHGSLVFE